MMAESPPAPPSRSPSSSYEEDSFEDTLQTTNSASSSSGNASASDEEEEDDQEDGHTSASSPYHSQSEADKKDRFHLLPVPPIPPLDLTQLDSLHVVLLDPTDTPLLSPKPMRSEEGVAGLLEENTAIHESEQGEEEEEPPSLPEKLASPTTESASTPFDFSKTDFNESSLPPPTLSQTPSYSSSSPVPRSASPPPTPPKSTSHARSASRISYISSPPPPSSSSFNTHPYRASTTSARDRAFSLSSNPDTPTGHQQISNITSLMNSNSGGSMHQESVSAVVYRNSNVGLPTASNATGHSQGIMEEVDLGNDPTPSGSGSFNTYRNSIRKFDDPTPPTSTRDPSKRLSLLPLTPAPNGAIPIPYNSHSTPSPSSSSIPLPSPQTPPPTTSVPLSPTSPSTSPSKETPLQAAQRLEREEKRESFIRAQQQAAGLVDWDFWARVMGDYEQVARDEPRELSRAIQLGIPPALRGMIWQLMSASKDPILSEHYAQLLALESPHEKSIQRDLSRTFPKHGYFKEGGVGQKNLFNVVKAYSLYDEEVGYTQGLQFIVGPLLLNMPDEEAFSLLVRLMKSYDLRSHYTPNMPGLQLRLFQFDRLLEELLPAVFMHLLRQGVKSSMYASQWFLTLFGYRFPLELVSSVFDLVFAEGVEAIFRFAVAIMKKNEAKLVELEFEYLLDFLKNGLFDSYAPDFDDISPEALYKSDDFVREALQIRITPIMLDQFSEEWENLCRQQNAHTAELESLRKANQQLSLQVRGLEASLAQINIEHCDLVRQVVMAKLEREELEDELVKYKTAFADLSFSSAQSNRAALSALDRSAPSRQSASTISSNASAPSPSPRIAGFSLPRSPFMSR